MGTEVTTATFHPWGNIPAVSRPDFSHMGALRKPVCPLCVGLSRPSRLRAHLPLRPH